MELRTIQLKLSAIAFTSLLAASAGAATPNMCGIPDGAYVGVGA